MRFNILGHLEVIGDAGPIRLGGPTQRTVLAHLLLRANEVVPTTVLIDEVWGEEPPDNPRNTLQSYVSNLRKAIGQERIEFRAGGYVLHAEADEIDVVGFEALFDDARRSSDAPLVASAALAEALAMWRGPPLGDLADEPSLAGAIARLEDLRLTATERWLSAQLDIGRSTSVVGELDELTQRYPLRERLWANLMVALYRTGRQAEALNAYQRAREVLADQLGIDPSPELQELYQRILNQDPELAAASTSIQPAKESTLDRSELVVGEEFGGYTVEGMLGRGGTSIVYLAEHRGLGRKVALKVLTAAISATPEARERFVREAKSAAAIDHPNVLPVYEAGDVDGRLFIAMRYVEGSDLRTEVRTRGPLDPDRTLRIVRQIAGGLDAAHARGLVHRDVKPGNVLLTASDVPGAEHVYLSDFGVTRVAVEPVVTHAGRFVGTVDYAAPEQFEGGPSTPQTDIYSLGCLLYECLAGNPPFPRDSDAAVMYAHLTEDPPSLAGDRPELPPSVDAVIRHAMAKKPGQRFPRAHELADALEVALRPASSSPGTVAAPTAGERRWATVLFARVLGASSDRDPEDAHALARAITQQMSADVERYGGAITAVMTDGVMAVFGAPTAHEDDAERAVRAALAMRASVPAADPRLGSVRLQVGIDTGEGMAGWVGPDWRSEYTFVGEPTTAASYLRSGAGSGEILVGAQARSATHRVIACEEHQPVSTPDGASVDAWSVVGIRDKPIERLGLSTPIVGREAELALLRSVWQRVVVGKQADLCTVTGPPGIGKSRLLREIAGSIEHEGAVILGRCLPFGETTGYDAFGQQVKRAAGILRSHPETTARELLDRHVRGLELQGDAAEVILHLGVMLGLPAEHPIDRQLLFFSARRYVESLARRRPTALVFEDLHWAEPALLDLIQSLAARVQDVPLLLLASARPQFMESAPTWGAGLRHTALPLEALRDDESRDLAARLLPADGREKPAIDELVATSGGNPLFLEELVNALPDRSAEVGGVPGTVQAIIAARLDTLGPEERSALQDASVVGRLFWRGALATLGATATTLDATLDLLEARDFIRRHPTSLIAGDAEYRFKHVLTMEVAYATLPKLVRRERHASVAGYLEETLGDRVREHAALLAHHWKEGGEPAKAAPYLLTAGEVAADAGAKVEAIALFTETIALADELGDRDLRVRAQFGRVWARLDIGEYAEGVEDVEPLLGDPDPAVRGRAAYVRSRLAFMLVDADGIRRYADQAHRIAAELDDHWLERRATAVAGGAAWFAGDRDTFMGAIDHARRDWPAEEFDEEYGYLTGFVPLSRYWDGRYADGVRAAEETFQLGTDLSSLFVTMFSVGNLAMNLTGASRYEEAFVWLERGLEMGREREAKPALTGRLLNMYAGALREVGSLEEAREKNHQGLEAGLASGFLAAQVSARIDLAHADLLAGEIGRAERQMPELHEMVEQTHGWHQWLWTGRLVDMQALISLSSGRWDEAVSGAYEALRYVRRYPRPKYQARALITQGEALLALGQVGEAEASFREASSLADQLSQSVLRIPALEGLSRALERGGSQEAADAAHGDALTVIDAVAQALAPQRRPGFLGSPPVQRVIAR